MRARVLGLWESRAPRERVFIAVLVVFLGITLYLWLIMEADRARTQLRASVPLLRAQSVRLQQQASEHESLRAAPPLAASTDDLRTLMQTEINTAGLSHALVSIDAADTNQVQVVFSAVPFADWLNWVAAMQSRQIRFDGGRIEALPEPGRVNATGTFMRITVH
ncbi:type II secretion system protein M [Nitrosospira lacus]|uniref:General secretion pathway protein GspM n=1 Tax=Nitrosospira lacus TaxID=1288494 RepID=A0A1W6SP66_9PROT|nr:type II secretion system protein M [Nitrosospira lacus]ARO87585.1 type II secretion system protein M [Nitrosospira lacus]